MNNTDLNVLSCGEHPPSVMTTHVVQKHMWKVLHAVVPTVLPAFPLSLFSLCKLNFFLSTV